jgi:hypothetical protein
MECHYCTARPIVKGREGHDGLDRRWIFHSVQLATRQARRAAARSRDDVLAGRACVIWNLNRRGPRWRRSLVRDGTRQSPVGCQRRAVPRRGFLWHLDRECGIVPAGVPAWHVEPANGKQSIIWSAVPEYGSRPRSFSTVHRLWPRPAGQRSGVEAMSKGSLAG